MNRREVLLGAGATVALLHVPEAASGLAAVAPHETGEAVFIRTAGSSWTCIKSGWLTDNALEKLRIYRVLDVAAKYGPETQDTQWATFRPPVHDSYSVELGATTRVPFPETPLTETIEHG